MDNFIMIGGGTHYITNWPPKLKSVVVVKCPYFEATFVGKVMRLVSNQTAALVYLYNFKDYKDRVLEKYYKIQGKGYFLMFPTNEWRYCSNKEAVSILGKPNLDLKDDGETQRKTLEGMTGSIRDSVVQTKLSNSNDTSLLTNDNKPDYNTLLQDLVGEPDIQIVEGSQCIFQNSGEQYTNFKSALQDDRILEEDVGLVTTVTSTYDQPIKYQNDELAEGGRILAKLNQSFNSITPELQNRIVGGYLVLYKRGCENNIKDYVRGNIVGHLKYFKWQLDRPIDYNTLKYVIFQNGVQKSLNVDREQLDEAKRILMQEYMVALQPKPELQMWFLKRLIMGWYTNYELHQNIRLVKVLISQFRMRGDVDFNKQHGVLPSIVIYPKYGVESAKIVLKHVKNLFAFHTQYGVDGCDPTYFIKVNDLVYYTNGLIDLKMYHRNVLEGYGDCTDLQEVFDEKHVRIEGSSDPYKKLM